LPIYGDFLRKGRKNKKGKRIEALRLRLGELFRAYYL
jgi:hypothetical protein